MKNFDQLTEQEVAVLEVWRACFQHFLNMTADEWQAFRNENESLGDFVTGNLMKPSFMETNNRMTDELKIAIVQTCELKWEGMR